MLKERSRAAGLCLITRVNALVFGQQAEFLGKRYCGQKRGEFDEEEFFVFAKSYLSEAFPNPRRIDYPPDCELMRLAEQRREADPFGSQRLTCCSPCFNRYMGILAELKQR
jgi:hypothetical protein